MPLTYTLTLVTHSLTLVPHSKTPYLLLTLESPKVLYLLRTLEPLAQSKQPPPLRVFGVCLATTRRLKSRPTIKFLIKSFSYCCHSLIAFQPGVCSHFPSFYKTRKDEPKKTDGTVHARRSVDARTKPKLKRRPLATGRSGIARTKPKLQRRPQEKGRKKALPLVRSSQSFLTFLSLSELFPSDNALIH